jgi:hypothetical protein
MLILLSAAAIWILFLNASNPVDYRFHSVYVYNFIKYIEWPSISSEFRIHILGGDTQLREIFETMAAPRFVEGNKIMVKQFNSINELSKCDVLFIPQSDSHLANRAIEKVKEWSTLVITEKNGLSERGSCINFVLIDNKLNFEINKTAIDQAGLKVSSQLLKMGIVK